jgi:serine/threonine protein kinase
MAEPTLVSEVKRLGTRAALAADPRYAGILENVFPLTGHLGNTRTRVKTLGEGSFGRVNLEDVNTGQVAAKYFTDPRNVEDNVTELAVLKDLQGLPYVAQLIGVNTRPAALAVNAIAPAPNVAPLNFPVALMGKAKADLFNDSLYTSWDDIEQIVIQVLKGMAIVHGQGIVHRDVKIENMLMTASKEVWISDFGKARYTDKDIPPTKDIYTGTLSTASPEILMKSVLGEKSPTNYEKSDMWSVGVSLYHIVTGDSLFSSKFGRRDVLEWMFRRSGFPKPGDGETFRLYQLAQVNGQLNPPKAGVVYLTNPTAYKERVLDRASFQSADPARLETFADVIQRLLTYNPDSRPTALEALHAITGEDFVLPPRRSLLDQYVNTTPLPAAIAGVFELSCYKCLKSAYTMYMKPELPFTVDRALIYARSFLIAHPDYNPDIVTLVSLCIADILLDTSADRTTKFRHIEILDILNYGLAVPAVTRKDIDNCITAFMSSDVQFLGRTFFDDLIDATPPLPFKVVQTLGLLNFVCHQYSVFSLYVGRLDVLKQRMLDYILDPANIVTGDYFRMRFEIGAGVRLSPVKAIVTNFLTYIRAPLPPLPPVPGGGRRMNRKKTRKSKYQRTRKTRQRR